MEEKPKYLNLISKRIEIDLAHRLQHHKGKCKNIHGHRYFIEVSIKDKIDKETGMVIDFGDLKNILEVYIINPYDHSLLIHKDDKYLLCFKPMVDDGLNVHIIEYEPTAENMSYEYYQLLKERLPNLYSVKVWETPTSMSEYKEED